MGQETSYAFDAAGNLAEKIDAKNQKAEYGYDDAGRLIQIRYYAADEHVTPVKTVGFTYDAAGNLKSYTDGTTSGTYIYDDLHRKIAETVDYGAFQLSYGYSYYKNGMKSSFIAPDGIEYAYTYDANNQLASVQIPGVGAVTVNAYQWNRPSSVTLPGGTTRTYAYDPLMRVKQIAATDPGGNNLMGYQYDYDRMDNITAKATEHGTYSYRYDDLYRLTASDNPQTDVEGFSYDSVGNRLTSTASSGIWGYNGNNELLGYDAMSFIYDDNGNMVSKSDGSTVTNYIYNVEDRLSRVEDGVGQVIGSYYYDPFGRRLWKEVDGVRTYFLYSDEGLIGEYDALGTEIKAYGWKPGSSWSTDPLFLRENGQVYFYHNDHLGTPQQLTSVSGAVVWKAVYNAFGEAFVDPSSTATCNLRFAGQYFDLETSLHYNFYRHYNSILSRYSTQDPIGFRGGNNFYSYASNNPVNIFDNKGLDGKTANYEAHLVIGLGFMVIKCCDENNRKKRYIYFKRCIGIAAGGGATFAESIFDEKECGNPPEEIWLGFELGGSLGPVTGEFGGPMDHEGPSVGAGYSGFGLRAKGSFCSYSLEATKDQGCCEE